MTQPPRVSQLLVPVDDLDAALAFYRDRLGLELLFRDGDRFAALDGGGVKLCLAGPDERRSGTGTAPALRVARLDRAAADAGLDQDAIRAGGHERYLEVADPSGNPVVLYEPD